MNGSGCGAARASWFGSRAGRFRAADRSAIQSDPLFLGVQVNSSSQKGRFRLSTGQTKTRRTRNLVIAFALGCGALLVYAAVIFRFGAIVGNRPL
jgi:hypothetical protein